MFKNSLFYCLAMFLLTANTLEAEIKFADKVCVNDVAGFVYVPTNGKTVANIYWEFGDGFTSYTTNCIHVYTKKGTYRVKGVVKFTDSSTLAETADIEIMGLPSASFIYQNFTDSCTYNNQVCLKDLSTPDNVNQSIAKKIITWGDGNTYSTTTPFSGEVSCNSYVKADRYKIFIEVTDVVGCKSTFKQYVTIREGINVSLQANVDYIDCKTAKVCVRNISFHGNKLTPKYTWKIDSLATDTNAYLNSMKCLIYKASKNIVISLTGTMPNGCTETSTRNIAIDLNAIKKDIELSDTAICYGSGVKMINAKVDNTGMTDINWYMDKKRLSDHSSSIDFYTDDSLMLPGYHYISCEFIRGNCSTMVTKVVHVRGPLASFEVFNFNGCIIPEKRMFFINQSTYDPKFTSFNWTIEDDFGDKCTTNRSGKLNRSDYCNFAVDSFAIHRYRQVVDQSIVTFRITDSRTGCYDEEAKLIINKCSRLCQGGTPKDIEICLGDLIFDEAPDVKLPYKITFNNGLRWYNYPVTSDSIGVGTYNMDIIFKNEYKRWLELYPPSDSFQIRSGYKVFYDTFNVLNKLIIHYNRKDTIAVNVYHQCSPFLGSLSFANKQFRKGEIIDITWGDGSFSNIIINSDRTIDSITHVYKIPGLVYAVKATVQNPAKCKSFASAYVSFGKTMEIEVNNTLCAGANGCFTARIHDVIRNYDWADSSFRKRITWRNNNSSHKDTGFNHCDYFPKGGNFDITLQINDTDGCVETITKNVKVYEIRAGIKNHMREIFCTELTQFYDSSSMVGDTSDFIKSYFWDFGSGEFTVVDKDPSKAFDLPADSLRITHVVVSNKGCTDTAHSALRFIGANTYFRIKDTIACGHLDGVFYNLSTNCTKFIWEYGNDSNTTYNTDLKETAYKTYRKVGHYKVRLRGIRSVFNPFTNNMYFCSSIFPDPDYNKDSSRTVWVLPDNKAAILSRDTICVHDSAEFRSGLDSLYTTNIWSIQDSSFSISGAPYSFTHQFNTEGIFNIKMKPQVPLNNAFLSCVDSAVKKIYVVKVRAGFEINDNYIPNIVFNNKSTPKYATYAWNFGDSSSGYNTSTDENPSHTYMDLSKTFNICLIATLKYGCADTVCKPLGPYLSYCSVYNVFTPGVNDGYNDLYDVQIEGESLYDLRIYDRWGLLVYKCEKDNDDLQNNNWNGRLHNTGPECPSGTYYYLFNYAMKIKPEEKKTVNGVITLIR